MRRILPLFLILTGIGLYGQIEHPKASPFSTVKQDIGLTTLEVQYSRPAVRGRTVFGGLVPFGRIWRVGANASTKFTTNTSLTILGNELLPGTYALYAFPYESHWEVVFHTNTDHWGDGRTAYDPAQDAFRIIVVPETIPYSQENFLITFDSITYKSARMYWIWDHTKVTIPIEVDTRAVMETRIREALSNKPGAQTYYEIARYYQEEGIKYHQALDYLDTAIELGGDTYYFHRVRSLVLAALDRYPEAIRAAEISRDLAAVEGKDEFVRMNVNNIKDWKLKAQ